MIKIHFCITNQVFTSREAAWSCRSVCRLKKKKEVTFAFLKIRTLVIGIFFNVSVEFVKIMKFLKNLIQILKDNITKFSNKFHSLLKFCEILNFFVFINLDFGTFWDFGTFFYFLVYIFLANPRGW